MNIGKLRHRVKLQGLTENQDGYGQAVKSYTTYATVWASIEPLSGREIEHAKQITAETNYRITIRYNGNVKATDRVAFGDRTFEITAVVNPEERNEYLVLMCSEVN